MIDHGVKSGDRASHLTSVQYRLALAVCDSSELYDVGHSPQRIADDVQAFMQKVSVSAEEACSRTIRTHGRRVLSSIPPAEQERLVIQVGDPQRPFDGHRVEEKFRRSAPAATAFAEGLLASCRAVLDANRSPAALAQDIARATGSAS